MHADPSRPIDASTLVHMFQSSNMKTVRCLLDAESIVEALDSVTEGMIRRKGMTWVTTIAIVANIQWTD